MAKGYTTAEAVQSQLGRLLTAPQIAYLRDTVIPAVEEWIDTTGGRAYGEGVVLSEPLAMTSQYTWLPKAPVLSVEAVRGWYWGQTVTDVQTLDPTRYALVTGANGYFRLPAWQHYAYLEVDYTPDPTIPSRIRLAAGMLCGVFMRTVLHPQTEWLTDYASGQDIRLKFRELVIPSHVYELVGEYGSGFVIA